MTFSFKHVPFVFYSPCKLSVSTLQEVCMLTPYCPQITSILCKNSYSTNINFTSLQQFLNNASNLKELRFSGSPSTPFPIWFQLPTTLKVLQITASCSLSLPLSLKELDISIQWPLNNTIIPSLLNFSLTYLSITGLGLDITLLPSSLLTLKLNGTFKSLNNVFFNLPKITNLHIKETGSGLSTSAVLPHDSLISYLPPTVTILRLPHNSMSSDLICFPPNLKSLCIDNGSEWAQTLSEIEIKREYPHSITELEIHLLSLPRLNNIPPNLTHLNIHVNDFNQPLDKLPETLRYLSLDTRPRCFKPPRFDQPLNNLPSKLESLKLTLLYYNHPLDQLPPSLTKLKFYAKSFIFPLDYLPPSLTNLRLSIHFFPYMPKWPPHLQKLHLLIYCETPPPKDFPNTLKLKQIKHCHTRYACWCTYQEKPAIKMHNS